jgi:O-antigen/teichoic acid export membrane protein
MRSVFTHALIFGLAPLLRKCVGLIMVPIYTHYLSTSDYGEIELLSMATGLFGLVLGLDLRAGYMRAWIKAPDASDRAALLAGTTGLLSVCAAAGTILFLIVSRPLSIFLLGHWIGWGYAAVLAIGLAADVVSLVFSATLQALLRSTLMVTLSVGQFALGLGVTAFCVVYLRSGPVGFFLGGAAASVMTLAVTACVCFAHAGWAAPDWRAVGKLTGYSAPLLAAALMFFVVRNADRFIVSRFLSVADLGLYAMAWTLAGMVLTLVFVPIQTSLDVWRYRMHEMPDGAARLADTFRVVMALTGLAAVGISTFGCDAFARLINPAFVPAMRYVPWLAGAVILQAGYSIVASAFYVTGATRRWTTLFAFGAGMQVAASLALVPLAGILGACIAMIAANLLLYAGAALWGARLWPVPYAHRATLVSAALAVALPALRHTLALPSLPAAALADSIASCLFLAALCALGLVRTTDFAMVPRLFTTALPRGS